MYRHFFKRTLDFTLSLAGLIIISPGIPATVVDGTDYKSATASDCHPD